MPQAPEELRTHFKDDAAALAVLKENFRVSRGGIIYPKSSMHSPTHQENIAIDYLWLEWDYGYQQVYIEKQ